MRPSIESLYIILSFPSLTLASSQPESERTKSSPILLPWTHRNEEPSRILKWTTDPNFSWWKRHILPRDPSASQQPLPPTPTKCSYIPSSTAPVCGTGCLCHGDGCASIFFTNLTRPSPRPAYHVCTQWKLNHDNQIRYGLQQAGFNITKQPVKCGWQRLYSVMELRVGRGKIDVNGTQELNWGDPQEVLRIEQVLKREYPFVEILVILATLVGPIFMAFATVGWYLIRGNRDAKKR